MRISLGKFVVTTLVFVFGSEIYSSAGFADELPAHSWSIDEIQEYGSLICALKKGKGKEVTTVCEQLGFIVTDVQEGEWIVCEWKGKLQAENLNQLKSHEGVEYCEPNLKVSVSPAAGAIPPDQVQEFNPVFDKDRLPEALKQTKELICAWESGKAVEATKIIDSLKITVTDVNAKEWYVCACDGSNPKALDSLISDPSIKYIEPNWTMSALRDFRSGHVRQVSGTTPAVIVPQDPLFSELYGLRRIGCPVAWKAIQVSPVIVAVCDTGVDYTHEDLADNMWKDPKTSSFGADFVTPTVTKVNGVYEVTAGTDPNDRNFHGTHVAGTIGAVGNNNIGVCGVNWRVQLMAVRCLDDQGNGSVASVTKAIEYSVNHGATVINLSLGGMTEPSKTLFNAMQEARNKGVTIVCAAGNENSDNGSVENYPANYAKYLDNVIVVANVDETNTLSPSSNYGAELVHLAAPGTGIKSTTPMTRTPGFGPSTQAKYDTLNGTSMAAPHVSGAVALILGLPKYENQRLSPDQIKSIIVNSVSKAPQLSGKVKSGGVLNIQFVGESAETPPQDGPLPQPIVVCPKYPPCHVICPPINHCPQFPCRVYRPCRRH